MLCANVNLVYNIYIFLLKDLGPVLTTRLSFQVGMEGDYSFLETCCYLLFPYIFAQKNKTNIRITNILTLSFQISLCMQYFLYLVISLKIHFEPKMSKNKIITRNIKLKNTGLIIYDEAINMKKLNIITSTIIKVNSC